MAKINISLPDSLLAEIDRRASASDRTRSGFIQEAAANYIAQSDYARERAERAARIEQAIKSMREIGASLPPGPDGVTLIRQMRDEIPEWARRSDSDDE